jgi:hypothetical protein
MRPLIVFFVLFVSPLFVAAQTSDSTCPKLAVFGPSGFVKPGEIGTYVARIDTLGRQYDLRYKWTVTDGTIVSGQGTEKIGVRNPTGWTTTVTLEVGGLPVGCPNDVSETAVYDPPIESKKLSELSGSLTGANFSGVVDAMKGDPNAHLYIIMSGSKRNRVQSLDRKRKTILAKLVPSLGGSSRITFVLKTETDDQTVIWLVPQGATPPNPSR